MTERSSGPSRYLQPQVRQNTSVIGPSRAITQRESQNMQLRSMTHRTSKVLRSVEERPEVRNDGRRSTTRAGRSSHDAVRSRRGPPPTRAARSQPASWSAACSRTTGGSGIDFITAWTTRSMRSTVSTAWTRHERGPDAGTQRDPAALAERLRRPRRTSGIDAPARLIRRRWRNLESARARECRGITRIRRTSAGRLDALWARYGPSNARNKAAGAGDAMDRW